VKSTDEDSGDRITGQDKESLRKQGPEAAVHRDIEGVAERDPATNKGRRSQSEEAHRTMANEGKEIVDKKGPGDPSSWKSKLERVHGSIGGPCGFVREEIESLRGSPRRPEIVDGNGKWDPLALEFVSKSIGSASKRRKRSTKSAHSSSCRGTPHGGLGSLRSGSQIL
jgi:hypothetical protein